jgi:dolichyl-phosphate-mannose--protein O-mannosyl transferase
MTDIPSLFFWLACMYCALRAAGVANAVRACAWMAAAAALGVAGGTVRQVV